MKNSIICLFFIIISLSCKRENIDTELNLLSIGKGKFRNLDSKIYVKSKNNLEVFLSAKFDSVLNKNTVNEKIVYSLNMKLEMKTKTDFTLIPQGLKKDIEFEEVRITMDTLISNKLKSVEYFMKDKLIIAAFNKQLSLPLKEVKLSKINSPNQISNLIISLNLKYKK